MLVDDGCPGQRDVAIDRVSDSRDAQLVGLCIGVIFQQRGCFHGERATFTHRGRVRNRDGRVIDRSDRDLHGAGGAVRAVADDIGEAVGGRL